MTTKVWPYKDPDEILDYTIDWTNRLTSPEAIATSTWTISGTDNLLAQTNSSFIPAMSTVWLSAGTEGGKYTITNRITTNSSPVRTMDQSVTLKIKSK